MAQSLWFFGSHLNIVAAPSSFARLIAPVLCCFIGLVPVSTVLVAIAPYFHAIAITLFVIGAIGQLLMTLFVEISRAIDKRLWFLEAHLKTIA